jgi:hypothetical protein
MLTRRAFVTGAVSICLSKALPTFAIDKCTDAENAATQTIANQYDSVLKEIDGRIAQCNQKGIDPTKFPYFDKDGNLQVADLSALRSDLVAQKAKDQSDFDKQIKTDCINKIQPIQDVVDLAMKFATLGISTVLPKHVTNVDVSEIMSGKPLGGNGAVIPDLRESALNAIGAGGQNNDLAKVIRDPGRVVRCIFGC